MSFLRKLRRRPPPVPSPNTLPPYNRKGYMEWLSFANAGMLSHSNLPLFDHAIRNMPEGGVVLEIGSFAGLSMNHILYMMKQAGRSNPVVSVDEWGFKGAINGFVDGSKVNFEDYRKHVIESYRRNLMLFSPDSLPTHVTTSSDKFFDLWSQKATVEDFFGRSATLGGQIAFAYIDGDHTYKQSMRDFENVDRFIMPGGFIVFDDSSHTDEWGSHESAAEAANRPDYELISNTGNYLIMKRR